MTTETREIRRSTAVGDLIARYDVRAFSRPALLDAAVESMVTGLCTGTLESGVQVSWEWSILTIRSCEAGFMLCEPDFRSADPSTTTVDHVSVTAQVAAMQDHFRALTYFSPQECRCSETISFVDGVFELPEILMVRGERRSEKDSGWSVLPLHKEDADQLERQQRGHFQLCTYALLRFRPHLLKGIHLPAGSVVQFKDRAVVSVKDYDNHERLLEPDTYEEKFFLP